METIFKGFNSLLWKSDEALELITFTKISTKLK